MGTDHASEDCVPKWEYERLRADVKGSREWAEAEAAEVERLRAELDKAHAETTVVLEDYQAEVERLRANIYIWQKTAEDALDEAGRLRAENEGLRAQLKAGRLTVPLHKPADDGR